MRESWEIWKGTLKGTMMLWQKVVQFSHMDTSGEPMLHICCKFLFFYFTISSHSLSHRNILRKDEKSILGYDIMILSDLLHFSTSHDALISSVQMLLAKLESARIYVGVSRFIVCFNWGLCKLKGGKRQVLTRGQRYATLLSRRGKKEGWYSQKFLMKASKRNGWAICRSATWTMRLWEFGKLHVDIGLGAGLRIASSVSIDIQPQPQIIMVWLQRYPYYIYPLAVNVEEAHIWPKSHYHLKPTLPTPLAHVFVSR